MIAGPGWQMLKPGPGRDGLGGIDQLAAAQLIEQVIRSFWTRPNLCIRKLETFLRRVDQQGPLFRIDTNAVCPVYDANGQVQSSGNDCGCSVHVELDHQSHNIFRSFLWILALLVSFHVGAWWGKQKRWCGARRGGYERLGETID